MTPCVLGTYNRNYGAVSAEECVLCPPGFVCREGHDQGMVACPAGSYCIGGAKDPDLNPDNDDYIVPCPAGSYCPAGSANHLLCEPGTYQPEAGQEACLPCAAGKECPTSGLTNLDALDCPTLRTCATEGGIHGAVCRPGEYWLEETHDCAACPAGYYCWPEDGETGQSTEKCHDLYVCQGGSSSPRPFPRNMASILVGSEAFETYNGPAFPGHVASDGETNTACEPGYHRDGLYGTTCDPCPAGRYCEHEGMSDVDAYPCGGGYVCRIAATVPDPDATRPSADALLFNGTGYPCPTGYFCRPGAYYPTACPDGFYTVGTGNVECEQCPRDHYCNTDLINHRLEVEWWYYRVPEVPASNLKLPCADRTTCSPETAFQPVCDGGYYEDTANKVCVICPRGSYCRGGVEAGLCTAGYICGEGAQEPDPVDAVCPAGYYCPHGATVAQACPNGTMSTVTGAMQESDCTGCQPGYLCPATGGEATACPPGHYCPLDAEEAIPCPATTWSSSELVEFEHDCGPCPAGYACASTGVADLTGLDCPEGHFCPMGSTEGIQCPAGTYRNRTGGASSRDCDGCPLGYYCPVGTVDPLDCYDGTYCASGAATYLTVDGGYYSNAGTLYQATQCPHNHRCPRGAKEPELCTGRTVCPAGSELGTICGAGSSV